MVLFRPAGDKLVVLVPPMKDEYNRFVSRIYAVNPNDFADDRFETFQFSVGTTF